LGTSVVPAVDAAAVDPAPAAEDEEEEEEEVADDGTGHAPRRTRMPNPLREA
jgi:hypothetical protein